MAYWSHRRHHEDAWRWAIEELRPDVLLVQEAVIPEWVRQKHGVHWTRAYETGKQQPWGTGIVAEHGLEPATIDTMDGWFSSVPASIPGWVGKAGIHRAANWFAFARIKLPVVGNVHVGSVHSPAFPIEKSRLRGIDVKPMKLRKNPDLWFLDVLFHFLRPMLGTKLIIGGDFNASRLLDTTLGERGNNEFFDRIRDEGFVSLHRRFHEEDERTYFKAGQASHQLDYLYADAPVAVSCVRCAVQPCTQYSDHAPLLAEFG